MPSGVFPLASIHSASRCPLRMIIFAPAGIAFVAVFLKTVPMISPFRWPASGRLLRLTFHQFQPQIIGQHVGLVETKGRFAPHESPKGRWQNPRILGNLVLREAALHNCRPKYVRYRLRCLLAHNVFLYNSGDFVKGLSVRAATSLFMATVPTGTSRLFWSPYGIRSATIPVPGAKLHPYWVTPAHSQTAILLARCVRAIALVLCPLVWETASQGNALKDDKTGCLFGCLSVVAVVLALACAILVNVFHCSVGEAIFFVFVVGPLCLLGLALSDYLRRLH